MTIVKEPTRPRHYDVGLVVMPLWDTENPVLGPALLKAYLEKAGQRAFTHDFAVRLYRQTEGIYRDAFEKKYRWRFGNPQFVNSLFEKHAALVDETVEELLDSGASVFGFTLYSDNELSTIELARRLKQKDPGRLIVFGGPSCNKPKWHFLNGRQEEVDALSVADAIVPGEGEATLKELLERCKGGSFRPVPGALVKVDGNYVWNGELGPINDLNSLPFPDFSDCRLEDYSVSDQLVTYMTRGCIRRCEFCDVGFNWGRYRTRSGKRVSEEIRHQVERHPSVRRFWFCDSIVNANMKELESFCDHMRESWPPQDITWQGFAIIRNDMTKDFAEKMYRSGCRQLHIGIESGSQNVLNSMKKGFHVKTAKKVLQNLGEAGIRTNLLLMVGYPTETEEDARQTIEFLREVKPYIYSIVPSNSFTYIDVGMPLYDKAFEDYGLDPSFMHPEFWNTRDGKNTYPLRMARFEQLCEEAERMGLRIEANLQMVRASKERLLRDYRNFRREVAVVQLQPDTVPSGPAQHALLRDLYRFGHRVLNFSLMGMFAFVRLTFLSFTWLWNIKRTVFGTTASRRSG